MLMQVIQKMEFLLDAVVERENNAPHPPIRRAMESGGLYPTASYTFEPMLLSHDYAKPHVATVHGAGVMR
jgi:hypothetical protein